MAVSCIYEDAFIVPPHYGLPVVLAIFEELLEVVGVFSDSADHGLIWSFHVPFQALEGEDLHSLGNVKNCSLLGSLVLERDASALCIIVLWQEMDARLTQLSKKDADMHFLVN